MAFTFGNHFLPSHVRILRARVDSNRHIAHRSGGNWQLARQLWQKVFVLSEAEKNIIDKYIRGRHYDVILQSASMKFNFLSHESACDWPAILTRARQVLLATSLADVT